MLTSRLPVCPKKTVEPERPVRRKAVTIAAGFRCSDGVVVCTDTEHTTGGGKFNADKLFPGEIVGRCKLAVAGSGDSDYIKIAAEEMISALGSKDASAIAYTHGIRNALDEFAHQFYQKYTVPAKIAGDDNAPSVDLIVGIKVAGETELVKITETGAVKTISTYDCIGYGEDLCREMADWLYRPQLNALVMAEFAAQMVSRIGGFAKYVGKEAQVKTLLTGRNDPAMSTWQYGTFFGDLHYRLWPLLVGCVETEEIDDAMFDLRLQHFCLSMRERRQYGKALLESNKRFMAMSPDEEWGPPAK